MSKATHISRRTVLRGLGTAVALPWLEAMAPVISLAAGTSAKAPPRRLAFFYIPNGAHMPNWTPEADGLNFSLPPTLEPLASFKKDLLVLTNLAWRTESMPMAKEVNPRLVFERLFAGAVKGEAEAARAKRSRYRLSVLDF